MGPKPGHQERCDSVHVRHEEGECGFLVVLCRRLELLEA